VLRDADRLETPTRTRQLLRNISHEFSEHIGRAAGLHRIAARGAWPPAPGNQKELLSNVERGVLRLMRLMIISGKRANRSRPDRYPPPGGQPACRCAGAAELIGHCWTNDSCTWICNCLICKPRPGRCPAIDAGAGEPAVQSVKFAPARAASLLGGVLSRNGSKIWVEDAGPGFDPASENRDL